MKQISAKLILAFVLLTKGQVEGRFTRDIIFPGGDQGPQHHEVAIRVFGGEDSDTPSGVAAVIGGNRQTIHGLPSPPPPPIVRPEKITPRPNREKISWEKVAELRRQNIKRGSGSQRPVAFPGQGVRGGVAHVSSHMHSSLNRPSHSVPVRTSFWAG